jgi:hypothetical protein
VAEGRATHGGGALAIASPSDGGGQWWGVCRAVTTSIADYRRRLGGHLSHRLQTVPDERSRTTHDRGRPNLRRREGRVALSDRGHTP